MMKNLSELFQFWDNDCSGYVAIDFVECAILHYSAVDLSNAVQKGISSILYSTYSQILVQIRAAAIRTSIMLCKLS